MIYVAALANFLQAIYYHYHISLARLDVFNKEAIIGTLLVRKASSVQNDPEMLASAFAGNDYQYGLLVEWAIVKESGGHQSSVGRNRSSEDRENMLDVSAGGEKLVITTMDCNRTQPLISAEVKRVMRRSTSGLWDGG